jgi:hypothetical protein
MSKHTPGPWSVADRLVPNGRRWVQRNHTRTLVALVYSTPEREANARLIAAAPDLLEACNEALEFAEDQEDVLDGSYGQPEPNRAMQVATMLRAAIAKAEGKQ